MHDATRTGPCNLPLVAAAVPAGVSFTATLDQTYTYVGQGTARGALGPAAGAR